MDHRVFQPRPTNNEARRNNAIGMAAIVCVACFLWLLLSRQTPVPAPPVRAAAQAHERTH